MGLRDRKLPPIASEKTEIQVVGPANGFCSRIVDSAVDKVRNETVRNFEVKGISSQSRPQIGGSDGVFFLFLHPSHSNYNTADKLNEPVVKGLIEWFLQSMASNTDAYAVYEGVEDEMSGPITRELQKHGLLDAKFREHGVDKGDTSSMYSYIVANANSIK